MVHSRASRGARPTAVLMRLSAFLVAAASVLIVPWTFVAAAAGHLSAEAAFTTGGGAAGLSLLTSLAARRLDPLRTR